MSIRTKFKKGLTEIDKFLPKAMFYSFIMSRKEKKLFDKRIKNSKVYLEFGMGGSTFRVLQKSNAKIYSIDSSLDWISFMREYRQIKKAEKDRLSLFHIDIGPTRDWGRPKSNEHREKYPNYSAKIFRQIDKKNIDTVLIDGRFRVACTLKTILECQQNKNIQIIIHDFWNREQYHSVLNYLDVVDRIDSLGVFAIKKHLDFNSVKNDYELYKYDVE